MSKKYDVAFIGHICLDEIVPFEGQIQRRAGSAVLFGSLAAARAGKKVLVITKMNPADADAVKPMKDAGCDVVVVPSEFTTRMKVVHPVANVDVREMYQPQKAGFFQIAEMPDFQASYVHLAGITDQDYTLDFMAALSKGNWELSTDLQCFVRQVNTATKEVSFGDVKDKKAITALMRRIKLDIVEAELLTGTNDIDKASGIIESWGCPEVMITKSEGVLLRVGGKTYFEKFTNRNVTGRTGRGDTTFGAYLAWRLEHDAVEAMKFAAALVSIKMEKPGPFSGTLQDVLTRMSGKIV